MKQRISLFAVLSFLALFFAATPLLAQPGEGHAGALPVEVTGSSRGAQVFEGTFHLAKFVEGDNGTILAEGLLTGTVKRGNTVGSVARTVWIPVTDMQLTPANNPPCPILDLVLGPLDLNLLGLQVDLSQIELEITAIPGGGLLGDLLCALLGGIDLGGAIGEIVGLLNDILDILTGLVG
jgi:hypothetical protein